jgi:hypothetical protein
MAIFLKELKKSQKEQSIKTKQEDSEMCCHGVMTDVLGLHKAPKIKDPLHAQRSNFKMPKMPFESLWIINALQLTQISLRTCREKFPHPII